MKTYEKIITVLVTLALFVCLYLTGLSVIRTAARYVPELFKNTSSRTAKSYRSFSAGGFCGNNLTWKYADGILTINGKGQMKDYKNSDAPWATLAVTTVKIGEGVTDIGSHAFNRNGSIKYVLLPSTLKLIKSGAFNCIENLPDIYVAPNNTRFTSFSGILFRKGEPVAILSGKHQKIACSSPAVMRQITSHILYILLYVQTICQYNSLQ